jgi:predicted nucleic acid-binding protein
MTDRVFVDSSIVVYAHAVNDKAKHDSAVILLRDYLKSTRLWISAQVLGEFYSAMLKNKYEHERVSKLMLLLAEKMNVRPLTAQTMESALTLKDKYGYLFWDSLILASALECGCTLLISEDMQHNQIIEGSLRIRNPFLRIE